MRKRVLTGTVLGLVLFALGSTAMEQLLERQANQYQGLIDLFIPFGAKIDEMHLLLLQQESIVERTISDDETPLAELREASQGFDEALAASFAVCFSMLEPPVRGSSVAAGALAAELEQIQRESRLHSEQLTLLFASLNQLGPGERGDAAPLAARVAEQSAALQESVAELEVSLRQHYEEARIEASATRTTVRQLFVAMVAVALILGTLANVFFYRSLLPLKSMVEAVRDVAQGDYEVQVPVKGGEEIAFLAGEFNAMAEALVEQRAAIERSQEVIRATFDGIDDVLVVHDENDVVLHANPPAYALAQSRGRPGPACFREVLGIGGDCPGVPSRAGDEPTTTLEIIRDPETGNSYEVSCQRVAERDGIRVVVEFVRDITEKLQLERFLRQSEKLTAIGELSLGVAHEVRNPLSTIQMTLDTLARRQDLSRAESERVGLARHEVERLERLVSSLLDYGRQSAPQVSKVPLRALIEHSVELVQTECSRRGVAVDLQPLGTDLPDLEADRDQLIQVLVNLLLNAIQASPEGEQVHVRAAVAAGKGARDVVSIEIADHGSGIEEKELKRIFTPFFTTRRSGTGLGLPVARKIVEAHAGELTIESEVGRGTRALLELPLQRIELASDKVRLIPGEEAAADIKG